MYLQMNPNQLLLNNLNFVLHIKIIKAWRLCFAMNHLTLGTRHRPFLHSEMRIVNSTCPPVYVVMQINWDTIGFPSESSGRLVTPPIAGLHPHRFWRFWFSKSGVGLKNLYSSQVPKGCGCSWSEDCTENRCSGALLFSKLLLTIGSE